MKIQFNHVISVAVVFVVTSANAKNVPQSPVANYQSSPVKPSARMSSSNLPVSHIEASEMSTTVTTTKTTLVALTASITTVTSTSIIGNTVTTTIKETANNTTAMSPVDGTAATQAVTITNVAIETQTDENGMLVDRYVIRPPPVYKPVGKDPCPKGYSLMSNGNCKPSFPSGN